jgi:formamidopyrimidine-DNA glycosylase
MLEIPECYTITEQLNEVIKGKAIVKVIANQTPHGFAFYHGDPQKYPELLNGKKISYTTALAGQIEITAEDMKLLFGDGVNIRYMKPEDTIPAKHQLFVGFDDGSSIVCTIQMYGGMHAFLEGTNDNPYYLVTKEKPSPLTDEFDQTYFMELIKNAKQTLSAKAFLATEQRIPGLGNGSLQDILYHAGVHPKRKINSLSSNEMDKLYQSVKQTIRDMAIKGGRDTEKDLFGNRGGYKTKLSSKTYKNPCPQCGGEIIRQAYLGGNIYFCPKCQPNE